MTYANVMGALDDLRREYAGVGHEVERLQRDLTALQTRQERLAEAIQSLERLNEPNEEHSPGADRVRLNETDAEPQPTLDDVAPDGLLVPGQTHPSRSTSSAVERDAD